MNNLTGMHIVFSAFAKEVTARTKTMFPLYEEKFLEDRVRWILNLLYVYNCGVGEGKRFKLEDSEDDFNYYVGEELVGEDLTICSNIYTKVLIPLVEELGFTESYVMCMDRYYID